MAFSITVDVAYELSSSELTPSSSAGDTARLCTEQSTSSCLLVSKFETKSAPSDAFLSQIFEELLVLCVTVLSLILFSSILFWKKYNNQKN
jgi:hypothetical protein